MGSKRSSRGICSMGRRREGIKEYGWSFVLSGFGYRERVVLNEEDEDDDDLEHILEIRIFFKTGHT